MQAPKGIKLEVFGVVNMLKPKKWKADAGGDTMKAITCVKTA